MTRIVAIVPLALAFAQLKSARVSTAGAIRARYHGSPRRVLFKATSINLSQDARCTASEGESNRDSFLAPEYQRGRTGDETAKPCTIAPAPVRLERARHYLRHGLLRSGPITLTQIEGWNDPKGNHPTPLCHPDRSGAEGSAVLSISHPKSKNSNPDC